MAELISIIQQILAPLSVQLTITAILAGVCLGVFYNYPLNLDGRMVFHKAVAGWVFILFVFIYRVVNAIQEGVALPQLFGWIGIGLLWTIFCVSIFITEEVATTLLVRRLIK
jgi:hypothetical protein